MGTHVDFQIITALLFFFVNIPIEIIGVCAFIIGMLSCRRGCPPFLVVQMGELSMPATSMRRYVSCVVVPVFCAVITCVCYCH